MKRARAGSLLLLVLPAVACTRTFDAVVPVETGTVCTPQSTDPDCMPTGWPVGVHNANSDPWLVTHNLVITSMSPTVLVLNFDATHTTAQSTSYAMQVINALAAGSTYHGYSNSSATPFLTYRIAGDSAVDLTSVSPPVAAGSPNTLDPTALFNDSRFPPLYGYSDSNGGYLTLCELFENGTINEVWIEDGGDANTTPRAPLYAERKQMYGDDGLAIPGAFEKTIGGFIGGSDADFALSVSCKVTVRLAHLDPSAGGGLACDLMVRGWGIEGMWSALPSLSVDAYAFLNHDFNTRFGLAGPGWPEICAYASPCVSYPGLTHATSAAMAPVAFDIPNFQQGCGNVLFPPNAANSYDFDDAATQADSRCAGFGLGGGPNGGDVYAPYSADQTIIQYDQMYTGASRPQSCGGGWQIYWRQSMPGYQNQGTASDGTPMKNWWPMLFY